MPTEPLRTRLQASDGGPSLSPAPWLGRPRGDCGRLDPLNLDAKIRYPKAQRPTFGIQRPCSLLSLGRRS